MVGYIVPSPRAAFGCVARRQAIASLVAEFARQWRGGDCATPRLAARSWLSTRGLQLDLHAVPKVSIDDGSVLAVEHLFLVADAARVDRVAENVVDLVPGQRPAALHPTRREDMPLRARGAASFSTARRQPSSS